MISTKVTTMFNCNSITEYVPKRKQFQTQSRDPQYIHAQKRIAQTEILQNSRIQRATVDNNSAGVRWMKQTI